MLNKTCFCKRESFSWVLSLLISDKTRFCTLGWPALTGRRRASALPLFGCLESCYCAESLLVALTRSPACCPAGGRLQCGPLPGHACPGTPFPSPQDFPNRRVAANDGVGPAGRQPTLSGFRYSLISGFHYSLIQELRSLVRRPVPGRSRPSMRSGAQYTHGSRPPAAPPRSSIRCACSACAWTSCATP